MHEVISETLGIEHDLVPIPKRDIEVLDTSVSDDEKVQDDFDFARQKMRESIEKSSVLLEEMSELATTAEHPRAYEVAANIATNITSMAESLLKLHSEKQKAKTQVPANNNTTVNNQTLVMTTEEVIKLLKSKGN